LKTLKVQVRRSKKKVKYTINIWDRANRVYGFKVGALKIFKKTDFYLKIETIR